MDWHLAARILDDDQEVLVVAFLDDHMEVGRHASSDIDNLDLMVELYSDFWLKGQPFVDYFCRAHQVSFGLVMGSFVFIHALGRELVLFNMDSHHPSVVD